MPRFIDSDAPISYKSWYLSLGDTQNLNRQKVILMGGKNNEKQLEYSHDNFYKAFAIAMLQWQSVEHYLYILFHTLIRPPQVAASGAVFYALDSFKTKLCLVDKTVKLTLKNEQVIQWVALKKRMQDASTDRNVLAHLTIIGDFREDGALQLVMAPPLFVPAQLVRNRTKKYDHTELECIAHKFCILGKDIEMFATEIMTVFR